MASQKSITYLFVVNEFSLLNLIWHAIRNKKVLILEVEPIVPYLYVILNRFVIFLVNSRRAKWSIDSIPDLHRVKHNPGKSLLYDVFSKIESWQNTYFRFSTLDASVGDYGMACKLAITNYMRMKHVSLLVLQAMYLNNKFDMFRYVGLPAETIGAVTALTGCKMPIKMKFESARIINFFIVIFTVIVQALWALIHTRPWKIEPKPIFFAADFIADDRDISLFNELLDGGDLLMVARGLGKNSSLKADLPKHSYCRLSDGLLSATDLPSTLKMIIIDEWLIYKTFLNNHPRLFVRLAGLPFKRLKYKCLFKRFAPQYYWGRDSYNDDHIIRRMELNKIGGLSYGVNTGGMSWTTLLPNYRYVSFDRFYVFGNCKLKKYYGETWSKNMAIIPAGSFTAHREHYRKRFDQRPEDIVVFTSVFIGEPELVNLVRGLAITFPDRKIIIQTKPQFKNSALFPRFISDCLEGLTNIAYSSDSPYDLFFRARYAVSDPSSIAVEAIQFGVVTFVLDLPRLLTSSVFREYPGLMITNFDQVKDRIFKIEEGTWEYPLADLQDIVDMSGMIFFDRIRKDVGLPIKSKNIPLII